MKSSHYLAFLTACCCCFILAWPKACPNDPFENPNDPAAENDAYIPKPNGLLIEDFNNGRGPNLLGYCHEIFVDTFVVGSKNSLAVVETSYVSYVSQPQNVLRKVGYSWRIRFDISKSSSEGGAFGGYVELLVANNICKLDRGPFNLEGLKLNFLTFWIRAEPPGIDMEVALKDIHDNQTTPKRLIREYLIPETVWRKAVIPIKDLLRGNRGDLNLKELREINFAFSYNMKPDSGRIYIDEIAFER